MRITKLLICICCLLAAPAVWGQAANAQTHHGVLGYLDPQTRSFHPLAPTAEEALVEPPALTAFSGTINLTITVTVKTAGITSVTCQMTLSFEDAPTTSPRLFEETDTVVGTGTTSGTKTCKLSIPYAWQLATGSTDMMSVSYTVFGSASTTVGTPPFRTSILDPYITQKVPAGTNTTTNLTAAAVTI